MTRFTWRTKQTIELNFNISTDNDIILNKKDIESLDQQIDDILLDAIEDEVDIVDTDFYEGGFYWADKFNANEIVEVSSLIKYTVEVRGRCNSKQVSDSHEAWGEKFSESHTELDDFEIKENSCIANINKSKLASKLSTLPTIGKYIVKDSISVKVSEVDESTLNTKDIELY